MSSAETAPPLDEPKVITASPMDVEVEVGGQGGGDSSKSSPGLSPSTWKPNADAAEWKPTFATSPTVSSSNAVAGDSAEGNEGGVSVEGKDEKGDGDSTEVVAEEKPPAGENAGAKIDGDSVAEGGGNAVGKAPPATEEQGPQSNGNATKLEEAKANVRYEIDFLLKLRPKPEETPRPEGLNPPDRVDILWDGKEQPTPQKAGSSMRGGIRPLPPLGSRQGSRGLGDARGAPPPLRGAQREMGRDRDSRMDSRGNLQRDDSRRSGGNDRGGRDRGSGGGGGGGRRAPVDTAPALEDCEPIQINEATRWKPKSLEGKDASRGGQGAGGEGGPGTDPDAEKLSVDEILMKANAVLNKMTLEKFGKLSVSFMKLGLRDPEVVAGVIDMLVDKAQMEPHFSSMYAELCERIARTPIPALGEDPAGKDASKGSRKFRKMLLVKCQEEFVKDWQGIFAAVQNDPDLGDDEKAEKEFVTKRKYTGHMRFVGELYKVELLKEKHVHAAIQDMFGSADNPDEERLECMVKLLQTCGKKLDQTGSPDTIKDMKRLFKRISKLADSRAVSSRIRFMLRDLIELRKNHWVPRREEEKAKTMQELHNDIAKEEESKNRSGGRSGGSSHHHGSGGVGGGGGNAISSSSIRPGSGDARVAASSRTEATSSSTSSRPSGQSAAKPKDDDGWETVPKKGKGDGWSQVGASRSRSSNPGSDERRDGGSGGSGGGMAGASAFALLGGDDEKEKRRKKKSSKDKKEKSSKSSKDKDRKKEKSSSKSSSGKKGSPSTSSPQRTVSSPVADKPNPTASPAAVKAPAAMTEETARKKGKDVVAEYAVSGELGEACTCLSEIDAAVRWAAVSEAVSDAMERKQKHRDALGVVLVAGAKDGLLDEQTLLRGINDVLDLVPDLAIDVPQAEKYVAAVVAVLALGGHLSLGPLLSTPCEGLLEGGKAASFATVAMAQVKEAAIADGTSEEDASAKLKELSGDSLDLPKLAAMLPAICRGSEEKAKALLDRHGVSL